MAFSPAFLKKCREQRSARPLPLSAATTRTNGPLLQSTAACPRGPLWMTCPRLMSGASRISKVWRSRLPCGGGPPFPRNPYTWRSTVRTRGTPIRRPRTRHLSPRPSRNCRAPSVSRALSPVELSPAGSSLNGPTSGGRILRGTPSSTKSLGPHPGTALSRTARSMRSGGASWTSSASRVRHTFRTRLSCHRRSRKARLRQRCKPPRSSQALCR
mmetsp:Transcript_78704/g.227536  ORF Transcript_78704/g.227536 Transcript_78704/m.227536 type:complete len:214 (+) Transcript_78704:1805-2446(+)